MKLKKGDFILIILLITAIWGWFVKDSFFLDSSSKQAVIKVNSEVHSIIPLENESREINVNLGKDYVHVKIEHGLVWVEDSSCPDKVCIRTGKISKPGQSIVCLPNKTVVTIEGQGESVIDDLSF
ncbi:MAG TPA: NusG domain II-containing protein [Peptococcaceae bacterium]|nr:NusG domain II-containing protein [Peptococcaceae bacterium]